MSRLGVCSTSTALLNLWQAAADHLDPDALEWYADLTDFARLEAGNISTTLQTLANLAANVDEADQPTRKEITEILYSTSYQLDTIAALIEVAGGAAGRLKHPDHYEKIRKARSKSKD